MQALAQVEVPGIEPRSAVHPDDGSAAQEPPLGHRSEGEEEQHGDDVPVLARFLVVIRRGLAWRLFCSSCSMLFSGVEFSQFIRVHDALDPVRRENLVGELVDLIGRSNRSGDETMVVPSDYLEVVVSRL